MKQLLKRKINAYLKKWIEEYQDNIISRSCNIYGIKFNDDHSKIIKPLQIDGGKNITIGKNSRIGNAAWLSAFESYQSQDFKPRISIGNNVNIGNYSCITSINKIIIGNGCLFSEYSYISDHFHGIDPSNNVSPSLQELSSKGPVIIGENTFLGFRVSVLPGVILGKHCVVGAHSVVTKSFDDFSMIIGSPARCIKKYNFKINKWESYNETDV